MSHKILAKSSNDEEHGYVTAFKNLEHKIENMFGSLLHNPFSRNEMDSSDISFSMHGIPRMDVVDRDDEILVKAELPGIEKGDIDVSISNNRLFIKAKSSHDKTEEKGDYVRREMASEEYYRTILLPAEVEDDKIKTSFKNGLLELKIPKHASSVKRKIKVE